jgi:hypothetical protein
MLLISGQSGKRALNLDDPAQARQTAPLSSGAVKAETTERCFAEGSPLPQAANAMLPNRVFTALS